MNEVSFIEKREGDWKRLTQLSDRFDHSPKNISRQELREFVLIYRRVSSDLAKARTHSGNLQLIEFLNDLVGRAYMILYRTRRGSFWKGLATGIAMYAQTVRKLKNFVYFSLVLFAIGIFGSAWLVSARPDMRDQMLPGDFEVVFDKWKFGEMDPQSGSESVSMTAGYWSNNPRVAIITGALAVGSAGLITTQIVLQNGSLLGILSKEMNDVGRLPYLLIRITPHGITEMSGMIFAAAGGFSMAWAIINPGRRRRGEALGAAAKDALIMYFGGIALMFIAAPIEGFFSFNPAVPDVAKIIFAAASLVAWLVFYKSYAKEPLPA